MKLRLHSFGDVDRSGKIRWTAAELGVEVEEARLKPGQHRESPYLELNPLAQIPTAELDGEVFIESSAICRILAERDPESRLIPPRGAGRERFNEWCSIATESLEFATVMCFLARIGYVDGTWGDLLEPQTRKRLQAVVARLPSGDFLVPGQFTIADIFLAYALRLAVQGQLVEFQDVAAYLEPLMARPAAIDSRFFESLKQG